MKWQLIQVGKTEWMQDDSGYYTLIHHVKDNTVRLDVMDRDDMPVISFQGQADDVRKCSLRWFEQRSCKVCGITRQQKISLEHAAYIGAELARCALLRNEYVQD